MRYDDYPSGTFGYVPMTTSGDSSTGDWWPTTVPQKPWGKLTREDIERIQAEFEQLNNPKQTKREEKKTRTLFRVIVVEPKSGSILEDKLVIAASAETAKLKAMGRTIYSRDLDDLDIVVQALGQIRPKEEVQKVKVVTEE